MRLPTEAETLQASAIIVAAPRYCGAFAAAIGIDVLSYWPGFAHVEIASGLAMAILEGWAIAFMFRRWGAMSHRTMRWWVLLSLQFALMLMLPMTVTPYLMSAQYAVPVAELAGVSMTFVWAWSFIVAAASPVILAAVGYADVTEPHKPMTQPAPAPDNRLTNVTPKADKAPVNVTSPVADVTPNGNTLPDLSHYDKEQRQAALPEYKHLSRDELAQVFGVSLATISRDRRELNGAMS